MPQDNTILIVKSRLARISHIFSFGPALTPITIDDEYINSSAEFRCVLGESFLALIAEIVEPMMAVIKTLIGWFTNSFRHPKIAKGEKTKNIAITIFV